MSLAELKVGQKYTGTDGHSLEILRLETHYGNDQVLYFDAFHGKTTWELIATFRKRLRTTASRTPTRITKRPGA